MKRLNFTRKIFVNMLRNAKIKLYNENVMKMLRNAKIKLYKENVMKMLRNAKIKLYKENIMKCQTQSIFNLVIKNSPNVLKIPLHGPNAFLRSFLGFGGKFVLKSSFCCGHCKSHFSHGDF